MMQTSRLFMKQMKSVQNNQNWLLCVFVGWGEKRRCHIPQCSYQHQSRVPFFCNWHRQKHIFRIRARGGNKWAWNQLTAPCIYFRLKSRGDIAVIPFVRLLCHFIYQKRIFHLNMSLSVLLLSMLLFSCFRWCCCWCKNIARCYANRRIYLCDMNVCD